MVEIEEGHLKSKKASPEGMTSNCVEEVDVMSHVLKRLMSADEATEVEARGICRSVKRQAKLILIVVLVTLIVCGISTLVMGSVAFIEERQKFNMGLGIPAGGFSVLAAAVSIHTSRGWGTSGASAGAAAAVLWAASGCLLVALIVQCSRTILDPPGFDHGDGPEEESKPSSRDLVVIASVQIALAIATLLSAVVCARIDYSA